MKAFAITKAGKEEKTWNWGLWSQINTGLNNVRDIQKSGKVLVTLNICRYLPLMTCVAFPWFFPCVRPHMASQITFCGETLLTFRTSKWFFSCVHSSMYCKYTTLVLWYWMAIVRVIFHPFTNVFLTSNAAQIQIEIYLCRILHLISEMDRWTRGGAL